ncbi:MAG TPA: aminotransferase class I/II-fold pyridoxal phosphate-dependent enzyme [Geminicoccaceae bacterium]
MLNPRLGQLTDYPFRRLARLLEPLAPPAALAPIDLSIGSPLHPTPELLKRTLAAHAEEWNRYPPITGTPAFRTAVADWLRARFALPEGMIDPDRHVLPVAGTKEALFMLPQVLMPAPSARPPAILMPNPFYNVYLGGAVMAGAEPVLLPVSATGGHLPDLEALPEALLERTLLFYLCSPANPQGAAATPGYLARALDLARRFGFLLLVDECYSEIYTAGPPAGALTAAAASGGRLDHLLVCHSLSKRSSAAGLRSGFVAGDEDVIGGFAHLRNYAAAVQPLPVLATAVALWRDEEHVAHNRGLYQDKHRLAAERLAGRYGHAVPDGGFFLWLNVGDGEAVAHRLWTEAALRVLPGGYIGRPGGDGVVPGSDYIRLALVHDRATTEEALDRLVRTLG